MRGGQFLCVVRSRVATPFEGSPSAPPTEPPQRFGDCIHPSEPGTATRGLDPDSCYGLTTNLEATSLGLLAGASSVLGESLAAEQKEH